MVEGDEVCSALAGRVQATFSTRISFVAFVQNVARFVVVVGHSPKDKRCCERCKSGVNLLSLF